MHDVVSHLSQMMTGAGAMRFLLQPLLAIVVGLLMGRHDGHAGRAPFLRWAFADDAESDEHRVLSSLRRVAVPLVLATGLSLVFQYVNLKDVNLSYALIAGVFLVAGPYLLAREVGSRVDLWWHRTHPHGRRLAH